MIQLKGISAMKESGATGLGTNRESMSPVWSLFRFPPSRVLFSFLKTHKRNTKET